MSTVVAWNGLHFNPAVEPDKLTYVMLDCPNHSLSGPIQIPDMLRHLKWLDISCKDINVGFCDNVRLDSFRVRSKSSLMIDIPDIAASLKSAWLAWQHYTTSMFDFVKALVPRRDWHVHEDGITEAVFPVGISPDFRCLCGACLECNGFGNLNAV